MEVISKYKETQIMLQWTIYVNFAKQQVSKTKHAWKAEFSDVTSIVIIIIITIETRGHT